MKSHSVMLMLLLSAMAAVTSGFRIPLVFSLGKCPTIPTQQDFNIAQYLGTWWEYQRFPAPFEVGGTCGSANYTLLSSDTIKVVNSGIQRIDLLVYTIRRRVEAVGQAVVVDPANPAELRVTFRNMPPGGSEPNYFVVATDYVTYAVVFSCSSFGIGNVQFAWILTREQGVAPANLNDLYTILTNSGVDVSNFITVDHSDCSLPEALP